MLPSVEFWVTLFGTFIIFAVVIATKHACGGGESEPLSPEQSQRAALAALAALAPPVVAAAKPRAVLPRFAYAQGRASETLVCAICLEALRDGEACSEVPGCRHVFHSDCVGAWARSSGSCPLCRTRIVPGPDGEAVVAAADDMV